MQPENREKRGKMKEGRRKNLPDSMPGAWFLSMDAGLAGYSRGENGTLPISEPRNIWSAWLASLSARTPLAGALPGRAT